MQPTWVQTRRCIKPNNKGVYLSLFFNFVDAKIQEGFGGAEGTPTFVNKVDCDGSESSIKECVKQNATTGCSNAGVTCKRSSSKL